jgi:uncharacterized protein YndB with AHSA1/START domain
MSRAIPAPVHDVWHALSDIPNARRWNPGWQRIEIISNQTHGAGTRFRAWVDDETKFDFEVTDWVVPEFISFTPIREEGERYAITLESHSFRLTPLDEETTGVEVIAHASTHGVRGLLLGLLFWAGHQKVGLRSALDNIEALFAPEEEDGEGEETDEPEMVAEQDA